MKHLALIATAVVLLTSCEQSPRGHDFTLQSHADSVAMQALIAQGGPSAWKQLRYLRFDFGSESGGTRNRIASHLWDRHSGAYRVEWNAGQDTTVIALFNVNTREGRVYLNRAAAAEEAQQALLERAYSRFINDTYWLLAPTKMLDEGVTRRYVADSSSAEFDVVALSFDGVGLTPGDRYWMWVDKNDGLVKRWAFVLQGSPDRPPSRFRWEGYKTFDTPGGQLMLAERKSSWGGDRALLTDRVSLPQSVPADIFTNPTRPLE